MITRAFLGAALTLLLGCAANPEPAAVHPMDMQAMPAMPMTDGTMPMQMPGMQMHGMQMHGMQMPMPGMMPGEACPCPACTATEEHPAP